jgi:dihydropteroate synthase
MGFIHQEIFPGYSLGDYSPVRLMGVVNLSPESFYKPSYTQKTELKRTVLSFIEAGATIIDIGARSTAPGVSPITIKEEQERIAETLKVLADFFPKEIILSIDTQYTAVAKDCLEFAVQNKIKLIINDVSSFTTDPSLMDFIVDKQIPCIIMASKNRPGDPCTVEDTLIALSRTIAQLQKKKYPLSKLIIDPAIGKWTAEKTYEYDLALLDNLREFQCFGLPILVGLSRKSFIGSVLNEKDPLKRDIGSYASTAIAVYNGAHIIRTHDINREVIQTIQMASAIRKKPVELKKEHQICQIAPLFATNEGAYHFQRRFGITPAGARIMKNKMITKIIVIKNVTAPQGLILKQELLARGGDVGLHGQIITTEWKKYDECFDIVLIGTIKQIENLIQKLKGQQLKLDLLARLLEDTLQKEQDITHIYMRDYPNLLKT